MEIKTVSLSSIRIDGDTQSRAALNDEAVSDYAETIRGGVDFPPATLFFDGKNYWLADGFHRYHAYRQAGAFEISAEVREGTKRDAKLFSAGANAKHGLRRTNADKRSAVMVLLDDDEWSKWSDREIARRVGVSDRFVNGLRPASANASQITSRVVERGGTTYTQNTAKVGKPELQDGYLVEAKRCEQAENDRQREKVNAQFPSFVAERESAKQKAIADRKAAPVDVDALQAENEELREANASLIAEVDDLKAELKKFDEMRVQFEQGGFDKVIAGKDSEIRALETRVYGESADKASWMKSAKFWQSEAKKLGYSNDALIDIENGEVSNG